MAKATANDPRRSIPAPAGYIRLILRQFGASSALRAALLNGADISEADLADPAAEATLFTFLTVNENLCRLVGEAWPLDAMAAWTASMQGALEVAARSAPTIGESLAVIARYGQVRAPYLSLALKRDKNALRLVYRPGVAISEAGWRALSATAAFAVGGMVKTLIAEESARLEFAFSWPTPNYAPRMREALSCAVRFGAPDCAVAAPHDLCSRASPYVDAALHAAALAELEQAAQRVAGNSALSLQIERLLQRQRVGRLSAEEAADELGLSRRTLVRRLSADGVTFRALLDAHLKERARQMLARGKLSRAEMSAALGFEDPTSFSRACRRWFRDA